MEFKEFNEQLKKSFKQLEEGETYLYVTNVEKDDMWETYLSSFPIEDRQSHTCNCCRSFIKQFGNVVGIKDNQIKSIWDFSTDDYWQPIVDNLKALVTSAKIKDFYYSESKKVGTEKSLDGTTIWYHFNVQLDSKFVKREIPTLLGGLRDSKNTIQRSLDEIPMSAIDTVLDLIAQNSLYRGQEFKSSVSQFKDIKVLYDRAVDKDIFCWKYAPTHLRMRNTAIGTLLVDLAKGEDLETSVKTFERIVAPSNYKRPTALVTKGMIESAEKKIVELGLQDSLARRYAVESDLTINNVLFADRSSKVQGNIFDSLKAETKVNQNFAKVEEITIDKFMKDVLPTVNSLEVFLENHQLSNFMSLITSQNQDAKSMFEWDSPFSWSYTGGIADSMKERVKQAGGSVDGCLRFTLQWNEDGKSIVDLDAHCLEGNSQNRIYYGSKQSRISDGFLDVDMQSPRGIGIENIVWKDLRKMKEGVYHFKVHNYNGGRNSGFSCQVEFGGVIHEFKYVGNAQGTIDIATVTLKNGQFTIQEQLPSSLGKPTVKEKFNLKTQQFHKVRLLLNSPNHWDGLNKGNKHWFFILEDCLSDESPRPFYNEFLNKDLNENRKVLEILASKLKVEDSKEQLSGIGFSETQKNSLIVKINSTFSRTLKILI